MNSSLRNLSDFSNRSHRRRGRARIAGWLAAGFLAASVGLTVYLLASFLNRDDYVLPLGVTLAGIPVGGLNEDQAITRLESVYFSPITLNYQEHEFQLHPAKVEFQIATEAMLAQIPKTEPVFLDVLWGRQRQVNDQNVQLLAAYSNDQLRSFLLDVSSRYDEPQFRPWADPVQLVTLVGPPGYELDVEASILAAGTALLDNTNRRAKLITKDRKLERPTLNLLEQQLRDFLTLQDFRGLFSLYLVDLSSYGRLHVNLMDGEDLPTIPDIAYSGMSIMKITILAEFYRQTTGGALPYELDLVQKSITESSNWTSNLLIEWIGDLSASNGIYRLNKTIAELGLESTFIGGLYDTEEPPGFRYTPANTRTDINTYPDPYMQTTPSDIGQLLEGIYRCADTGDGLLISTFPDQYTPKECRDMIDWLTDNRIGVLIEAGVPEGTLVAHKHAWAEGEAIGDAAVVFTPGADYVLVFYVWQPEYTYWEENSHLLANVSRAVYNHFNPITP